MAVSPPFPAEKYLVNVDGPPDFQAEWRLIVVKLFVTLASFVMVVPVVLRSFFGTEESHPVDTTSINPQGETRNTMRKHRDKRRKPNVRDKRRKAQKVEDKPSAEATDQVDGVEKVIVVPPLLMLGTNLSCILICFLIILNSPNNRDVARSVFQSPLFSEEECDHLLYMTHRAAERNFEAALKQKAEKESGATLANGNIAEDKAIKGKTLLDEPVGWKKDRHDHYPTVDLNLVTDPFTKDDRKFIQERLDARLSPVIERVYGIAPGAIRATDIFVVRYDFEKGQRALRGHTDSSHVSFNVLLNEDFTGGGTRFHNRNMKTHTDAKPKRGEVLINNAMVYHEGLPVTSGTRYILVGFLSVDRTDPITNEPTGLSVFASWLSLPWAQVKFTEGLYASAEREDIDFSQNDLAKKWTDNKYARGLFADLKVALTFIGDLMSPHKLTNLVQRENATDYLDTLDKAHVERKRNGDKLRLATWFKGQQLNVDIDGAVVNEWKDRRRIQDKFEDL